MRDLVVGLPGGLVVVVVLNFSVHHGHFTTITCGCLALSILNGSSHRGLGEIILGLGGRFEELRVGLGCPSSGHTHGGRVERLLHVVH